MDMIGETLILLNEYIKSQLTPMSCLDFFVQNIIPILQLLIILCGAGAGLYKYFKTKNQETYEKLLSEVYAPLYQYFVKQELFRKITKLAGDYHDTPVIEVNSRKTSTTYSNEGISSKTTSAPVLGLNRNELLKVLENINIGLASKELYTLLSMYQVVVYFEGEQDKSSDRFLTAAIMKIDIENKLRKEIISGYKKYHKKLGLRGGAIDNFCELSDDHIIFNIVVDEGEKAKLFAEVTANPTKYQ